MSGSGRLVRARTAWLLVVTMMLLATRPDAAVDDKSHGPGLIVGKLVAPGMRVTPTASPGSKFEALNPDIPADPGDQGNARRQHNHEPGRTDTARADERL